MIYYLLYPLHTSPALGFLNVLRYVPVRALAATMSAMDTTTRAMAPSVYAAA